MNRLEETVFPSNPGELRYSRTYYNGLIISFENAKGQRQTTKRNAVGWTMESEDADNHIIEYSYFALMISMFLALFIKQSNTQKELQKSEYRISQITNNMPGAVFQFITKNGEIVKSVSGKTYWTNVKASPSLLEVEPELQKVFEEYYTVKYENYLVPDHHLAAATPIPIQAKV